MGRVLPILEERTGDMTDDLQPIFWIVVLVVAVLGAAVLRAVHAGVPQWALLVAAAGLVVLLAAVGWAAWRWWPRNSARAKLRDTGQIRDMLKKKAAKRGVGLRRTIASTDGQPMTELACLLGRIGRKMVYGSWEDFTLVLMGPRSNKTSAVAVPRILQAPGAVIATSNKPDLWILTAALRAKIGPVRVFDPSQIAFQPQTWWWDVLKGVTTVIEARRLAEHFVSSGRSGGTSEREDPFFAPTGRNVLALHLLAAALSRRTMRDVLHWIDTYSTAAVDVLDRHAQHRAASGLAALLDLPAETRGGVWGEAQTALATLSDESVLRWVTPPNTWEQPPRNPIEELDLWDLFAYPARDGQVGGPPTLYLMTQEGLGSSGPVISALVARIFELGDLASAAGGGRLDPPITCVLDECANIAKIERLPELASHLGSKGICVHAIFQSEAQIANVWGEKRAEALWTASTIRILGAGLQDANFARKISDLVGTHKVVEYNRSWSSMGPGTSTNRVREPIMPLEEVSAMPKENALLIRQSSRPVVIDLMPWYTESEADDISTYRDIATRQVQESAIAFLGPHNPVAKALGDEINAA